MLKILIVEDELPIANLIKMSLNQAGYFCDCVHDGTGALEKIDSEKYDLILLDVMIPIINGFDLMEYIRPLDVPVMFITAMSDTKDKVKGLKLGGDDYITKPFEIVELLARVESVMRRYKGNKDIHIGDVEIDTLSRVVRKDKSIVDLTVKEYNLLLLFVQNKNIALFREVIYEKVWEDFYMGDTRTVDLHVQRLRKKLGWEEKIKSVYKIGYRFEV